MQTIKLDESKYLSEQISVEQVIEWGNGKVVLDCATGMGKTKREVEDYAKSL